MKCEELQEDLVAEFFGALEAPKAEELQAHAAGCAVCRAAVEDYARICRAVRELPAIEPSAEERRCLVDRVLQLLRVRGERSRKNRRRLFDSAVRPGVGGWFRRHLVTSPLYLGAAAAAVLLVVLTVAFIRLPGRTRVVPVGPDGRPETAETYDHEQRGRMQTARRGCSEYFNRTIERGGVDLTGIRDLPAYGELRVVPLSYGAHERLLVVLTDAERRALDSRTGFADLKKDSELAMLINRRPFTARIENSQLIIPPDLMGYLGQAGETETRVLRFKTRTEIWGQSTWDAYTNQVGIMLSACLLPGLLR